MELSPLVGALNWEVFALKFDLLAGLVLFLEIIPDVTASNRCFANFFVSDQDYLPSIISFLAC